MPKTKNRNEEKCDCIWQPLFLSIPIDHVVPDILHLFLSVSDVLTNLLIVELRRLDGINKNTSHFDKYIKFLNEDCEVSFHTYQDKESKVLKWRDLTGPEKVQVFNNIDLSDLFPDLPKVNDVKKIWEQFYDIYKTLQLPTTLTITQLSNLKHDLTQWMSLFTCVYQTENVTPYLHVLASHIPEFLKLYGSITPFSQQGLEKLNDDITKSYFRSTNHHDISSLHQLLLKLNRIEELTFNPDCIRSKKSSVMWNMSTANHNHRTCSQNNGSA